MPIAYIHAVDPNPPVSIPVGIIIGLVASFVQSLGLTIQRKSHVVDQALPEHHRRVEHRRPLWLLGFAIFISSNILGSLVQIAALPVVILAPLGAVSLLWNAFFARLILGDVFSPWMILGTIFIAGGAVLIAVFGIVPEPTRSLEDLLELFRRPAFAAYFSILAFVVVVSLITTHIAEFALARKLAQTQEWDSTDLLLPPSDIIDLSSNRVEPTHTDTPGVDDETTPLLPDPKFKKAVAPNPHDEVLEGLNRTRILIAISYASFSGILSGMCLIFAKSGVQLLLLTLGGHNQFWRWESWVLLLGLVVFALLQLWYLHKALILADPTLVCPSAFCFYNLSSILNGLVYFDQLSMIRPLHLFLVGLGIVVLLCGVWVVSIQAGGGVVDVAPWTDEPETRLCEEPEAQQENDVRETDFSKPCARPVIGPVPMERETRSESNIANLDNLVHRCLTVASSITSPQDRSSRRRNSASSDSAQRLSRRNALSPSIPNSPVLPSKYSLRHRLSSMNNDLYRQSWGTHGSTLGTPTPQNTHTHGPLSPPLNPTGFQIGLSPVSPGFAIMPMERRPRHPSGLGIGLPSSSLRRRTVSEGDVISRVGLGLEDALERPSGVEEGAGQDICVDGVEPLPWVEEPSRWKRWFTSIFRRKD